MSQLGLFDALLHTYMVRPVGHTLSLGILVDAFTESEARADCEQRFGSCESCVLDEDVPQGY